LQTRLDRGRLLWKKALAVLSIGAVLLVLTVVDLSSRTASEQPTPNVVHSSIAALASTTSGRSTTTPSWQVLKTDVTLSDYSTVCMVLEWDGHTCPTVGYPDISRSLPPVELISYQGELLYAENFTLGPYAGDFVNGQTIIETIWFTNSTIFCLSSPSGSYIDGCPA
jgi:hypothetical protein